MIKEKLKLADKKVGGIFDSIINFGNNYPNLGTGCSIFGLIILAILAIIWLYS